MSDVITGNTELAATKAEIIAAIVQKELASESVLAATVNDVSAFAVKGAASISFPKAGSFTVENRASAAKATVQALTFLKDTMPLNYRATVSWLVDAMDELQSSVDVSAEYLKRAARAHAVYLDDAIITELEAVGVATTTTGTITDSVILEMRASLLKRKANRRLLSLAISPDEEAAMLAINKFTLAQNYGMDGAVIQSGAFGLIYGMPVYITPELAGGQFFMYERDGIALGFQRGPMLDERGAPEYGAGSKLRILDQLFGIKGQHIAQQGVAAGKSALVEKDGNP